MTYEIRTNAQYNSREIYFDGKPSEAIRTALKSLKMRWNNVKKCWYGFASDWQISEAINNATPEEQQTETTVYTDGYLGGGAVYGGKSHLNLYGQDLKKAIAADIKKAGIKGVTLAMRHGNVYATIRTTAEDVKTFEEFYKGYSINACGNWLYYFDGQGKTCEIFKDKYFSFAPAEQEEIKHGAAKFEYYKEIESECNLNQYYLDRYHGFTDRGMNKIRAIQNIICAYRYDESNSMVDYFNTNFYYDLITKPAI